MKSKSKAKIENQNVHIPITMLASNWKGNLSKLKRNTEYTLVIDYPLEHPAKFTFNTGKNDFALPQLLKFIGECYEEVYADEDEHGTYGIWGHDIEDLNLSGIKVNHTTRKITVDVDS